MRGKASARGLDRGVAVADGVSVLHQFLGDALEQHENLKQEMENRAAWLYPLDLERDLAHPL
jgi:hypothetical protein